MYRKKEKSINTLEGGGGLASMHASISFFGGISTNPVHISGYISPGLEIGGILKVIGLQRGNVLNSMVTIFVFSILINFVRVLAIWQALLRF